MHKRQLVWGKWTTEQLHQTHTHRACVVENGTKKARTNKPYTSPLLILIDNRYDWGYYRCLLLPIPNWHTFQNYSIRQIESNLPSTKYVLKRRFSKIRRFKWSHHPIEACVRLTVERKMRKAMRENIFRQFYLPLFIAVMDLTHRHGSSKFPNN